jgi:hypothetical protein
MVLLTLKLVIESAGIVSCGVVAVTVSGDAAESVTVTVNLQLVVWPVGVYVNEGVVAEVKPGQIELFGTVHEYDGEPVPPEADADIVIGPFIVCVDVGEVIETVSAGFTVSVLLCGEVNPRFAESRALISKVYAPAPFEYVFVVQVITSVVEIEHVPTVLDPPLYISVRVGLEYGGVPPLAVAVTVTCWPMSSADVDRDGVVSVGSGFTVTVLVFVSTGAKVVSPGRVSEE